VGGSSKTKQPLRKKIGAESEQEALILRKTFEKSKIQSKSTKQKAYGGRGGWGKEKIVGCKPPQADEAQGECGAHNRTERVLGIEGSD